MSSVSFQYDSSKEVLSQVSCEFQAGKRYALVGVVPRDMFLFNDSLRNNLTLYREGYSDEQLMKVVKTAGLEHFVEGLADGLDSAIQENGKNLSGGEKQRVSLARVLLNQNDILLFDEFTANLDEKITFEIEESLRRWHRHIRGKSRKSAAAKCCG